MERKRENDRGWVFIMSNLHSSGETTITRHTLTGSQRVYLVLKAIVDFTASLIGLIICAIPMLILALAIKLDDRGPVFFRQKRVGKDQKTFMMLKFRTMRMDTPKDTPTHLLADPHKYITRIGKFLRRTSLDELPQIFNVLAGQMSLIGPRPALWNQFDLNEEREKYGVHQVRPGLTGWAQVNGRDELEIPVKARLDGEYVEKFGLFMDIRCFFTSFAVVFTGKGVVEGGTGEMSRQQKSDAKESK